MLVLLCVCTEVGVRVVGMETNLCSPFPHVLNRPSHSRLSHVHSGHRAADRKEVGGKGCRLGVEPPPSSNAMREAIEGCAEMSERAVDTGETWG